MSAYKNIALSLCLAAAPIFAAGPSIGVAKTSGEFRVNASTVQGNATLFNGSVVETAGSTTQMNLSGAVVALDTNTKVTVYSDSAVLNSGKMQVGSKNFSTDAGTVRVLTTPDSEAVVTRRGTEVVVGVRRGTVAVNNKDGLLVAKLMPGEAMSFNPSDDQGASAGNQPGSTKGPDDFGKTCEIKKMKKVKGGPNDGKKYCPESRKGALVGGGVAGGAAAGAAGAAGVGTALGVSGAVLGGIGAAAAVGLGVGIYEATKSTSK